MKKIFTLFLVATSLVFLKADPPTKQIFFKTNACYPFPSGMVGWWPANNNTIDLISANNGVLQNGATYGTGKVSQAFFLDGVDDYAEIPHSTTLQPTQITVMVWMKGTMTQPGQADNLVLLAEKNHAQSGTQTGWALQANTTTGRVYFAYGNGSSFPEVSSTTSILDDNWHLITAMLNATTLSMYVDGAIQNTQAYTGTPQGNNGSVSIGKWLEGNSRKFKGNIDELNIFNRALSATEIQDIFNAGSDGICVPPPSPYRTISTGNWNEPGIWERFNGSIWVPATQSPTSSDLTITLMNDVTVSAPVTLDEVIGTGKTLTVNATLTVNNGPGDDLVIGNLNLSNFQTINGSGNIKTGTFSIGSGSTWHGQYGHQQRLRA